MSGFTDDQLTAIRARFAHVDHCPVQGDRIFFENAGGALTLRSVVEQTRYYAGIPDNQGRDNPGSTDLVRVINQAKNDMGLMLPTQPTADAL